MKKNQLFFPLFALVAALSIAPAVTPAHAEGTIANPTIHPVVSQHLNEFKSTAYQLRSEAEILNSHAQGRRMSLATHSQSLDALKDHVNELGKVLSRMEELKPVSGDVQKMAMEEARTHMVAAAQNLTEAMDMVKENRRSITQPEYLEAVRNVHLHADSLYEKVDTVLDYEAARTRFDNLELEASSDLGS